MNTTQDNWKQVFSASLTSAARKCGCDISALKWEERNTSATWGNEFGLVFFGADAATCERAAKYFEAWARKHFAAMVGPNSPAQRAIGYLGERAGGHATSYVYYPGAD